jgi:tRNA pseudouridine32 synthase/23S rRNA pseudouridine746 synthase
MVLGLTDKAHNALSLDFEKRMVKKTYTALIDGKLLEEEGTIRMKIRPDIENRPYQIVSPDGKDSITEFRRLRIEKYDGRFVTRVLFRPLTGRTHQIRVHSAFGLGMPVVNDRLYGKEGPKLCLCATGLEFKHPVSGKVLTFEIEPDF